MRERLHIPIPIVVEGKYDKNTLSQLVDATILTTDGFGIFHAKERRALIRRVCEERGVILLTDADGGGRQIRSFLLSILPRERVYQVHIPRIEGKERRKRTPSRSGLLGVEGMEAELLVSLLRPFADGAPAREADPVTTADLYRDGLTGVEGATERRRQLCETLGLPSDLPTRALLEMLNLLVGRESYECTVRELWQDAANGRM